MDEYRPVSFQEILECMPEDERLNLEERWKALRLEEDFWNNLPEVERNKRIEKPKVHYDPETDTLWLKNGRPTPRSCDIAKGWVTVFFEADIWYPSAVMLSGAYRLLGQFFCPDDAPVSHPLVIQHGETVYLRSSLIWVTWKSITKTSVIHCGSTTADLASATRNSQKTCRSVLLRTTRFPSVYCLPRLPNCSPPYSPKRRHQEPPV